MIGKNISSGYYEKVRICTYYFITEKAETLGLHIP